jgi:hypothetical protein
MTLRYTLRDCLEKFTQRLLDRTQKSPFASLKADIQAGLESGPSQKLDMAEVKKAARQGSS